MRVSDYIAATLYNVGVEDVFLVTGGGSMFLTDGLACHGKIRCIPCLHEQAAAMAAISYAQYRENYGACFVTTGCGGTNTITGVLHAWQDNVPVIFVSGQCNRNEMMTSVESNVRQVGIQEADVVSIVRSITKYAITVMNPEEIVYHVEKALYTAKNGCPGPVWLDIPMDVQEALIEPEKQMHFSPEIMKIAPTNDEIEAVVSALTNADRPFILAGNGVRMSGAGDALEDFLKQTGIPMGGTRLGWDIFPNSNEQHVGVVDSRGNRSAVFALENADVILVLGSRLGIRTSGYNYELFAHAAKKVIVVDVNAEEHKKNTVRIDQLIIADVKLFLEALPPLRLKDLSVWTKKCRHWKEKWKPFNEAHNNDKKGISEFAFCREMNRYLKEDSVTVTSAGTSADIVMQTLCYYNRSQRYLGGDAQCEMGDELPAAIGASIAKGKGEVLCIVGDGSLQMNIQELQTIVTQKLPIKIYVWNNGGYASIRGHQRSIFKGRFVGVDSASGTKFPDLEKIANAYEIPYLRASNLKELNSVLEQSSNINECIICEIMCWEDDPFPMAKGKLPRKDGIRVPVPLEDMAPLIPREEFESEMVIAPYRWWEI